MVGSRYFLLSINNEIHMNLMSLNLIDLSKFLSST